MADKVTTNTTKGSIAPLPYRRKVRLLLWGGASKPSDNFTFEHAKNNVIKNYKTSDKNNYEVVVQQISVAKDIVTAINSQEVDNIRSLDIWTHGGPQALYMTTAEPPPKPNASWVRKKIYEANRWTFHNSSLYRSRARMVFNAAGWTEGSALVGEIDFSKFADNAKVEFHGCQTAADPKDADNIAADFSERLASSGKTKSSVIGHVENATPSINGDKTTDVQQDYRHGGRAIFKAGKLIRTTTEHGTISESELEK